MTKWKEKRKLYKKRLYYLERARKRAKNPEFKKLWADKKAELSRNL